jgi:hypothetical protein
MIIRRGRARGTTLMEVMMASVVLIIGLTGVFSLLTASSGEMRRGIVASSAASYAASTLDDVAGLGYCAVLAGPTGTSLDAGVSYDGTGRRYGKLMSIVDGGSTAIPTFNVAVRVEWNDANKVLHTTSMSTMVSRVPDGGC